MEAGQISLNSNINGFLLILESAHAEITVKNCGEVPKIISTFLTKDQRKNLKS